jgi:F-type H+-transporting ATPase subunit beta
MNQNIGKIVQIIGPVVDVAFSEDHLPDLLTAIEVPRKDADTLVLEVAQGIGADQVRCISMGSTDGLVRGMDAIDTGHPIYGSCW